MTTSAPAKFQPYQPAARTAPVGQQTAVEQSRAIAEVQAAVVVAQQIPRDIQRAVAEMHDTCGRLAMAKQAFYQVPNRGNGPSVHLLRELARIWGNVQHGTHELARDDDRGESEIQAWAWDVQTNTRTSRTFVVPHQKMKAKERLQLTDLGDIQNNNNNAGARAVRECIANVLPRWFTEEAQNLCRATLEHGEGKPLSERVEQMVAAFKGIGISQAQMEAKLAKKRGQWDAGDVAQMGIAYTSITRDGYDKSEMFPDVGLSAESIIARGKPAESAAASPPAPPASDPTPDSPAVEMITDAQKQKLAIIREGRYPKTQKGRADWFKWVKTQLGQELTSNTELTKDQATVLIDLMEDSNQ